MAAQKKVEVKIQPNVEDGEVDALENKIAKLKQQQIDLRIKTNQMKSQILMKRLQD